MDTGVRARLLALAGVHLCDQLTPVKSINAVTDWPEDEGDLEDEGEEGLDDEEPEDEEPKNEPVVDELTKAAKAQAQRDRAFALRTAPFNPSLHPRTPRGAHGGGQFLSPFDRIDYALKQWVQSGSPHGDPLASFTPAQLRSAAGKAGLNVPPHFSVVALKSVLLAYGQHRHGVTPPVLPAGTKITRRAGGSSSHGFFEVEDVNGVFLGELSHWSTSPPGWYISRVATNPGMPTAQTPKQGGSFPSKEAAAAALIAAHHHANLPPVAQPLSKAVTGGVAGVTQTVTRVPPLPKGQPSWARANAAWEIHLGGQLVGTVEDHGGGYWRIQDPAGMAIHGTPTLRSKSAAVQALLAHHQASLPQPVPTPAGVAFITVDNGGHFTAIGAHGTPVAGSYTRAADVLAAIHAHANPAPPAPKITTKATGRPLSPGTRPSVDVIANNVYIGEVAQDKAGKSWVAAYPGGTKALTIHKTRKAAIDALWQAYQPAPPSTPVTTVTASEATGAVHVGDTATTPFGAHVGDITSPATAGALWTATTPAGAKTGHQTRQDAINHLATVHLATQAIKTRTSRPATTPPEIKAAQDVLYGVDPKGKTATRQLAVYTALKKGQFDSMDGTEQTVILGDLAYIATTSKGPNAAKAQKLIDRFTPAGTPAGTMPTPSTQVVGPATGKHVRLPAPQGGLLRQATQSGKRGDGWISGTNGSQVWGEYGAGGLLLRHVDDQGVERFLMTQRGPGISDPGKWSYPGGAFESLEDPYQGSTREVAEELGWTDADFAGAQVHGYHVFDRPDVKAKDGRTGATVPWAYHSIAADVPTMMVPHLQTSGARAETSDAKWLTRAEIEDLGRRGMLHAPVAGGKLQSNVMSLFPGAKTKTAPARPGAVTVRPARLTGTPVPPTGPAAPHKPSLGRDLVPDAAGEAALRTQVAGIRKKYSGKAADERLAAIAELQGYDDTPTVVPKAAFDALLATGDYIEAWRGVSGSGSWRSSGSHSKTAAAIHEEMRSGPAYFGTGIFGNGYYLATDKSVAQGYSDGTKNSLLRVLIPKTAVTDTYDHVHAKAKKTSTSASGGGSGTLRDPGRYAAATGLDGIEIPRSTGAGSATHIAKHGKPAYNWVNRSVLIIQEADA